jgi:hypothetical protein
MKSCVLIFLIGLIFVSCKNSEIQQIPETNLQNEAINQSKIEEFSIPTFTLDNLTAKKLKEFNEILPLKARKFLENSEELRITVREKVFDKGIIVNLRDEELKAKLINAFYIDVAESIPTGDYTYLSCVSPKHLIEAADDSKEVEIEISYDCSKFYLRGDYGNSVGIIKRENGISVKVFNQIIEKYNPEIK